MTKNWPTPVDAGDYFRHEQKKVAIEERRPVIRRASDLVGPGIAASAVRITDWADTLATFNGYYASLAGPTGAPTGTEAYLGYTVMDAEVGGTQVVTGMTSGIEYKRIFTRNPADPEFVTWGAWVKERDRVAATAESTGPVATSVPDGVPTDLTMPAIARIGDANPWQVSGARLNITQPGVYTGDVFVSDGVALSNLTLTRPSLSGLVTIPRLNVSAFGYRSFSFTFTFATTATNQYVSVSVTQTTGAAADVSISSLVLTRTSQI